MSGPTTRRIPGAASPGPSKIDADGDTITTYTTSRHDLAAVHEARHLVLRRGDVLVRWHRIETEFSEASVALDDARLAGVPDDELTDLKMSVIVNLWRFMDVTREFWELDRQLDLALADALAARIDWEAGDV